MNKPSSAQLRILIGLQSGLPLLRDSSGFDPARYYFDGKRINPETAKVLYCRGWIRQKASNGGFTLYELSEAGPAAIGSAFAINTTNFNG